MIAGGQIQIWKNVWLKLFEVKYFILEKATEHFKLKCICPNSEDFIEWKNTMKLKLLNASDLMLKRLKMEFLNCL